MKISIIIVTYNSMKWIEKCIDSIKNSTIQSTIIIVDNNSSDATVVFLKNNYKNDIVLIQSDENLGFGKGNNLGIKKAIELNADYLFLLNQDTILMPTSLEVLVKVATQNPDYGIISPIHLNYEGTELEYYFSKYINTYKTPTFLLDHIQNNNIKTLYETEFVNCAAWLIPFDVLKKVGGFDPVFWHYGEDDNYGQRLRYHGYKIGIVSGEFIFHDSKERIFPDNYLFTKSYYVNYTTFLLTKYGDINVELSNNNFSIELNIILFEILGSIITLRFKSAYNYYKQIYLLKDSFSKLRRSREVNKNIVSDFTHLN